MMRALDRTYHKRKLQDRLADYPSTAQKITPCFFFPRVGSAWHGSCAPPKSAEWGLYYTALGKTYHDKKIQDLLVGYLLHTLTSLHVRETPIISTFPHSRLALPVLLLFLRHQPQAGVLGVQIFSRPKREFLVCTLGVFSVTPFRLCFGGGGGAAGVSKGATARWEGKQEGKQAGEGGRRGGVGGYSFVACLNHLNIDNASLSVRSTVPTSCRQPQKLSARYVFLPYI